MLLIKTIQGFQRMEDFMSGHSGTSQALKQVYLLYGKSWSQGFITIPAGEQGEEITQTPGDVTELMYKPYKREQTNSSLGKVNACAGEAGGQRKGMTPIQENDSVRRQTDYSHISARVQQECAVLWTIDY
ncbi:hypothetical protein llap_18529 [Limosa lapponica baueri]|uniref:Uncharacterized protein n=1 Tax=Limosa lapponica baueri TaxID=1758121 RepID=A0A2I0TBJ6_LIMLA|nr:hypothetical protein llap_18529 [Limosa lapponica baueri]